MCFAPDSAAIIGASSNPSKFGGRALKFCIERGFGGRLYPVNARTPVVQGLDAWNSVSALPEAPDIAVIAVPAAQVRESLVAAGEKGCKIAVVYGAQFAEAGAEGQARQDDLLKIARKYGMRMIGPNCMGVMSLASGFVASFTTAPEHHDGRGWPAEGSISVASQSGAVGIQMFAQLRDRGLGLANWISTGNQADIDVADAIAYFAGDPATKTIAVYMEDASRGLKLVQALELARQARKPVVAIKVGTTPLGGIVAAGHTASMYVEDRVVEDIFAQYGVLRAASITELVDLAAACNAGVAPASNEVAAVSVSGGGAVMIADEAEQGGLELPAYSRESLAELKAVNPFVNDRNPVDISAPSMSNMQITGGHLKWGTERGLPTMLGYISHVPLVPRTRREIMPKLLELKEGHPDQLVAIAGNFLDEDRKRLVQAGVAVFGDPSVAARAVAKLVRTGKAFQNPPQVPSRLGRQVAASVRATLSEAGIPLVHESRVESEQDALAALSQHGAVVLKLAAEFPLHKTELGGVYAGLENRESVCRAYARLTDAVAIHSAAHSGLNITVSPMVHGVEMLVGTRRDPHFGPLVLLGTGGTFCEVFDDVTYRKAPVTHTEAEAMISSVKSEKMLGGWRGAPAADRDALAETLVKLSGIAEKLPSLEINPLIVAAQGVMAVDLVVATNVAIQ